MKNILHPTKCNIGRCFDYTQILIDIFYDPIQISCPHYSHVDWDCDSLDLGCSTLDMEKHPSSLAALAENF